MRFNKRASLDLSINAIVILVLAIAMLGLGLGFTKGMFAKFSSKLDVPPPNIPATAEEPVVLPQEEMDVKHGKDFAFQVNFYNDQAKTFVNPIIWCPNIGATGAKGRGGGFVTKDISNQAADKIFYDFIVSPQDVAGGTFKGFKFIFRGTADTSATPTLGTTDRTDDYSICTIIFTVCKEGTGKGINGAGNCVVCNSANGCDSVIGWPAVTKQVTIKIT